jgi:hypothetical protein
MNDLPFDTSLSPMQQTCIQRLFEQVQQRFPEIEILSLQRNPEDKEHIWINVLAAMPEEREIALSRYAAGLSADLLVEYDVMLSIMPENPMLQPA